MIDGASIFISAAKLILQVNLQQNNLLESLNMLKCFGIFVRTTKTEGFIFFCTPERSKWRKNLSHHLQISNSKIGNPVQP